jgi:hypothetical protein
MDGAAAQGDRTATALPNKREHGLGRYAAISTGRNGLTKTSGLGFGDHQDSPGQEAKVEAVVAAATREANADAAKVIIARLFPAATRPISNTHHGSFAPSRAAAARSRGCPRWWKPPTML